MGVVEYLFANVLSMSTIASVTFFITVLFRKLLMRRYVSSKVCLLWIVFVCTLIIPIKFSSCISIKNLLPKNDSVIIDMSNTMRLENNTNIDESGAKLYSDYIPMIWLITSLTLILRDYYLYRTASGKKFMNCLAVPNGVTKLFNECKEKLNITDNIELVVQDKVKTPSLCGIFRTKILLTNEVLELSKNELEFIFIHELNHYKNGHHIIYLILNLIKRVYFFNPLIYVADRLMKQDLEYATDESVLRIVNDRRKYLLTILKILAFKNNVDCSIPSICSEKLEVERRLIQMKERKIDTRFTVFIVMTVIIAMSLITISLATDRVDDINEVNHVYTDEKDKTLLDEKDVELVVPLKGGKISAKFGTRENAVTGEVLKHTGIDVVSDESDEIVAVADGSVISVGFDKKLGNNVKVKHSDDSISTYACGSKVLVTEGEQVKAGDTIMMVGSTGMSTGKHLHFELTNADGEYVDVNQLYE